MTSHLAPARTVRSLFATLRAADPGRPRLVWYGAGDERVELSARVLENWVAKTTNLLVEEFDADASIRVRLDLPAHWRRAVWALATWCAGARLVYASVTSDEADVVITTLERVEAAQARDEGAQVVAVALGALTWSAATPGAGLPAGVLDYNAVVAGYGDDLPAGTDLPGGTAGVDLAALVGDLAWPTMSSAVVEADGYDETILLAALRAGAGLVIVGPGGGDPTHIADQERGVLVSGVRP